MKKEEEGQKDSSDPKDSDNEKQMKNEKGKMKENSLEKASKKRQMKIMGVGKTETIHHNLILSGFQQDSRSVLQLLAWNWKGQEGTDRKEGR